MAENQWIHANQCAGPAVRSFLSDSNWHFVLAFYLDFNQVVLLAGSCKYSRSPRKTLVIAAVEV